jgi:hypothetical protein
MDRSNRKRWLTAVSTLVLLFSYFVTTSLQAGSLPVGPVNRTVTLLWDHDPGPYSYNIYETTNLPQMPETWVLKTNVLDLTARLQVEPGDHFFTVSCVDTNTGLESLFATR